MWEVLISFEGIEGCGKSTQADILVEAMSSAGLQVMPVHEPGSTSLGQYLRRFLKEESVSLTHEAELLLFCAARAELVSTVLRPTLDRGVHVVADRFSDSTMAYQGYGRGLDLEVVRSVNSVATGGLMPDLTFLLDLAPAGGLARVQPQLSLFSMTDEGQTQAVRQEEEGQRGFEVEPLDFHRRVRRGYLELAEQEPERWVVLDAAGLPDELAEQIWQEVRSRLGIPTVA
jgi:dTMP kinase